MATSLGRQGPVLEPDPDGPGYLAMKPRLRPAEKTHRVRRLALDRGDQRIGYIMIAPLVIGAVVFGVIPFGYVVWYSLHNWVPVARQFQWIGLQNYVRLISDPEVINSLIVTGEFVASVVVSEMAAALMLAVLLNRRMRGIGVFRAAFFVPVVITSAAWTIIWKYLLAGNGVLNAALSMVGITGPNWLLEKPFALFALVAVVDLKSIGIPLVILLAGLQNVPAELKEAGAIDGASSFRIFASITWPLLTPTVFLATIVSVISALDVFVSVQVLTTGGPANSTSVLAYTLYQVAFGREEFGYGSAIGVVLFMLVFGVTLLQWFGRRRWVHE